VEGLKRQAVATWAETGGFRTRQDACDVGCMAACERAAVGARAPHAVDDCRALYVAGMCWRSTLSPAPCTTFYLSCSPFLPARPTGHPAGLLGSISVC
jgi:hypothetical protein